MPVTLQISSVGIMKKHIVLITICLLFQNLNSNAQNILIDQGVQVAGIWCFPSLEDPKAFYYLPSRARLAENNGKPKFSYMRYVDEAEESQEESANSILKATGGGILHFLILYDTPESQLEEAALELYMTTGVSDAKLKAPIIFKEGTYALVSSIIDGENTSPQRKLMARGKAPVLEGNTIAVSFELDRKHSKMLLESFKMNTPDISLVYDLTFDGLSDAYQANLEIDWQEVREHHEGSVGGSYMFIGAEAGFQIEEMMKKQAIKLTTAGENQAMDQLMNLVMDKALGMIYDPVPPPVENDNNILESITRMMGQNGKQPGHKTSGFGFHASYKYQHLKKTGKTVVSLNARTPVSRHHFLTFNAGDLYKKFGNDPNVFKTVDIEDDEFLVREIRIGIDGSLYNEFSKMLNSVSVEVKKEHQNGDESVRSLIVDKRNYDAEEGKNLSLSYKFKNDHNRQEWFSYEYRTIWQFQGGGTYVTPWESSRANMINLYLPFERREIFLAGDFETILNQGYRAVSVQLQYPFFGRTMRPHFVIQNEAELREAKFEVTLPLDQLQYEYNIQWIGNPDSKPTKKDQSDTGIIFIDEIQ